MFSCHLCQSSEKAVHVTVRKTEARKGGPPLPLMAREAGFPLENQAGSRHPHAPSPRGPERQSSEPSGIQAEFSGCQASAALRMNSGLANAFCLLSLRGERSDLAGPEGVQAEVRGAFGKMFKMGARRVLRPLPALAQGAC